MEINDLMNNFNNVYITHNFWEGNKAANWTTNQAVYKEQS